MKTTTPLVLVRQTYRDVEVLLKSYFSGEPALILTLPSGELLTKASLSLEASGEAGVPNEVWIKNYSENEGVLPWLIAEGIIERECERVARLPYGDIVSRHRLTPTFLAAETAQWRKGELEE